MTKKEESFGSHRIEVEVFHQFSSVPGFVVGFLRMDSGVLDDIINRLLEYRHVRAGKQVQLNESEIRQLCTASRDIFLQQSNLLELEAPIKICGVFSWSNSFLLSLTKISFFSFFLFFYFLLFFLNLEQSLIVVVFFPFFFYGVGVLGDWGLDLCFEHWLQRHIYGLLLFLAGWFFKILGFDRMGFAKKSLWVWEETRMFWMFVCHIAWNSWIGFLSAVQTFNFLSMVIDGILVFLLYFMP